MTTLVVVAVVVTVVVAAAVAAAFLVSRYNSLVQVKENVDKAWANIEVLLQQRSEELPKLIDTATHYLAREREILREVTEARSAARAAVGPREEAGADQRLRAALGNLFAVAEDYPELRSSENFQQLQERISALEGRIADRREFYNESTTLYNARIQQIPDVVIAAVLKLEPRELFRPDDDAMGDVEMADRLSAGEGPGGTGGAAGKLREAGEADAP